MDGRRCSRCPCCSARSDGSCYGGTVDWCHLDRPRAPCSHDDHEAAWCDAYRLLERHAERMSAHEGAAQLRVHLAAGRRRSSFGSRRYPFIPSATLTTICAMMADPTMTPTKALAFIHAPSTHAWNVDQRMRNTG